MRSVPILCLGPERVMNIADVSPALMGHMSHPASLQDSLLGFPLPRLQHFQISEALWQMCDTMHISANKAIYFKLKHLQQNLNNVSGMCQTERFQDVFFAFFSRTFVKWSLVIFDFSTNSAINYKQDGLTNHGGSLKTLHLLERNILGDNWSESGPQGFFTQCSKILWQSISLGGLWESSESCKPSPLSMFGKLSDQVLEIPRFNSI